MKSAAVPKLLHFCGSWALMGDESFCPKARSAEILCTIYEIVRHRPCCSACDVSLHPQRERLGAHTRLVFDLDAIAEQVGEYVGRPIRVQNIKAEFLGDQMSEIHGAECQVHTLFKSIIFQKKMTGRKCGQQSPGSDHVRTVFGDVWN